MSTDLAADMHELESKGIQLSDLERARWGSVIRFRLPGGARIGLYQPCHPSPLAPEPACTASTENNSAPTLHRGQVLQSRMRAS